MESKQIIMTQIDATEFFNLIKDLKQELNELKEKVNPTNRTITRFEAAEYLGITLQTLYKWTQKGLITQYKLGHKVFYKTAELDEALKAKHTKKILI